MVELDTTSVQTVDQAHIASSDLVVQGLYSLLGAVTGKCRIVKDFEALTRGEISIGPNDILVAAKTSNYWNQYLTDLKGIITMDGSPTAHPMLIGRERNLAVICGVAEVVQRLEPLDGMDITMDGLTKGVYKGAKPQRTATREEFLRRFEVQQPVAPLEGDQHADLLEAYAGRLALVNGQKYVRTPNSPITPVWAQLQIDTIQGKIALLNEARTDKVDEAVFNHKARYVDGYVVQEFRSEGACVRAFEGMALQEVKKYHSLVQGWQRDYLDACKAFLDDPDLKHWRGYTYAYPKLYGALDNAWIFEAYLKGRASSLAFQGGVSQFHFDQLLQNYQCRLSKYEEDLMFRRDINLLAIKIGKRVAKPLTVKKILEHVRDADCRCMGRMKRLARDYRIKKNAQLSDDYPMEEVAQKVLEAIEEGATEINEQDDAELVEIWPGSRALNSMVEELIKARVQKSNMHHIKTRGQNMVKQGLIKVAAVLEIPVEDLYNAQSAMGLEKLLVLSEEQRCSKRRTQDVTHPEYWQKLTESGVATTEIQPVTRIASMGAARLKSSGSGVKKSQDLATMQSSAAKLVGVTGLNQSKFEDMGNCKKDIEQLQEQIHALQGELEARRAAMAECQATLIDDLINLSKKDEIDSKQDQTVKTEVKVPSL